jgi:large subunit ribosomal protein L25
MAKVEVKVKKREELGKKNKKLRAQGLIPAVVYGRKFKSTAIAVSLKEFEKKVLQSEAGENLIFTLKLSEDSKAKSVPVITHHVQRNPLNDAIIHVDLMHISMDEALKTRIPVELTGLPIGVKEGGGVLVHGLREIEVKCLPGDIPDKFEIDVSSLEINHSRHVSDLKISKKVEVLVSLEEMVATVSPPTKEEEVAPPPLTPEEEAAAAAAAEGAEAVAGEEVKEKAPPGAAPAEKAPAAEKPARAPSGAGPAKKEEKK